MKVLIIHAHPEKKSFNGALTRHAREVLTDAGHEILVSDLYRMKFDPVSDRRNFISVWNADRYVQQKEEDHASKVGGFAPEIEMHLKRLDWCDVLIFQFPLWWFSLPAILKGWVDRVFARGRVYGDGQWFDNGMLRGKRAMLSVTTGGSSAMFTDTGLFGNIHDIMAHINRGMFALTGCDVLPPFIAWAPAYTSEEQRQEYLVQYRKRLLALGDTSPIRY